MELTQIKTIKEIVARFGFVFKKGLGQNFLTDPQVLKTAVRAAEIDSGVLEIGPGFGVLTYELAKTGKRVVSVEVDKKLLPVLEYTLSEFDNVEIVSDDILKIDVNEFIGTHFGDDEISIAANLPYYITTPIITTLLEARPRVKNMVFMVQYEVAERICADRGRDAGAISLFCRYFAEPEIIEKVPAASFYPPPKVDSALLLLKMRKKPPVEVADEAMLFKIIRASFAQRRKTLANALSGGLGMEKETLFGIFDALGIDRNIRGEKLSLDNFADICNTVCGLRAEN